MYLTRLIYFSRPSAQFDAETDSDLDQILSSCRGFNDQAGITGALWYDGDYFVQVIEGDRAAVSKAFYRIMHDTRHSEIEIVCCEPVDSRVFPGWRMARVEDSAENRELISKYSGSERLDPSRMSAQSLLQVIAEGELLGA